MNTEAREKSEPRLIGDIIRELVANGEILNDKLVNN